MQNSSSADARTQMHKGLSLLEYCKPRKNNVPLIITNLTQD